MSFPAVEYSKCAFLSMGCVCMYLNVRVVLRGTLVKVKLYFYGGSTSHVRIALPLDAIIHVQLHLSQPLRKVLKTPVIPRVFLMMILDQAGMMENRRRRCMLQSNPMALFQTQKSSITPLQCPAENATLLYKLHLLLLLPPTGTSRCYL